MAEINEPLSDRELDVLALLVQGSSNRAIAESLFISPNTVKVHVRNIYTKLGVSTRTEATVAAVERELVTLSGEIRSEEDGAEEGAAEPAAAVNFQEEDGPQSASLEIEPAVRDQALPAAPPKAPARRSPWLWPVITLLALLIALLSFVAPQLSSNFFGEPTAVPGPPADVQIDDTRWFVGPDIIDAVWGGVLISAGVDLFQIGGENETGEITGAVSVFDSTTGQWRTAAPKPTPVRDAGGANLGGFLYIVGGKDENDEPVNLVEAYSPSENVWRPVADLPRALFGGAVVSDGGLLYYLGGHDGREPVRDAYVYNPSSDGWSVLTSLPEAHAFAAAGFINNSLLFVGGENDAGVSDDCQRFDLQSETWDTCAPLSRPRSRAGAAVVLNKMYILGGETDAHFGELFDPNLNSWEIINVPMLAADGPTTWISPGVTNIEAKIYLIGGRLADGQINGSAYVYAPLVYRAFFPATQAGGASDR